MRENARLQTFPDWFAFRGNYTTGGRRRQKEVPRFTQVANAVPPLLAEQLGLVLLRLSFGRDPGQLEVESRRPERPGPACASSAIGETPSSIRRQ